MRALLVVAALALLAGGGPARARQTGRHPHRRFHPGLTRAGPGVAELTVWLEALRTGDPRLCTLAVDRLEQGGWDGNVQHLAGESTLPPARRGAVQDPAALALLGDALADSRACVRRAGAVWLGDSPAPDALARLLSGLRSANPAIREAAAHGLGVHGEGADREALVAALRDGTPAVAIAAA
ncbi:MAG: HEAT repeat domain-containing protein, partial [Myxococcaceae bacterium]